MYYIVVFTILIFLFLIWYVAICAPNITIINKLKKLYPMIFLELTQESNEFKCLTKPMTDKELYELEILHEQSFTRKLASLIKNNYKLTRCDLRKLQFLFKNVNPLHLSYFFILFGEHMKDSQNVAMRDLLRKILQSEENRKYLYFLEQTHFYNYRVSIDVTYDERIAGIKTTEENLLKDDDLVNSELIINDEFIQYKDLKILLKNLIIEL